ncbi:MAG TPA: ricin-type beta-trefoil lectin domain protein [Streptosporangiaceae bacterium]|nr:ricin-type beta-trefoil lectin domain protein [Streptosporangiaceae bacterium]
MIGRRVLILAAVPVVAVSALLAGPASAHAKPAITLSDIGFVNYDSPLSTSGPNTLMCMGISGGKPLSPAVLWACNGHADQLWQSNADCKNAGPYTFCEIVNNAGQCLATQGGAYTETTDVYGWNCKGSPDQFWAYVASATGCGGNYFALLNYNAYINHKNNVVGVQGGETNITNGAHLILWNDQETCNNQMWVSTLIS